MSGQKRDGIDLNALAGVIHSVPGVECSHVDGKEPSCVRDARHVIAAGWVSPAAVAGRDAEIQRLRSARHADTQKWVADLARLAKAEQGLGAVAALADEWVRRERAGDFDDLLADLRAVLAPVSGAVEGPGASSGTHYFDRTDTDGVTRSYGKCTPSPIFGAVEGADS